MLLAGVGLEISSIASVLSVVFALSIAFEAYFVYRRTEREHFLAYFVAFTLLAISYGLLIPLAFGVKLPTIGYEVSDILSYPPRIVISSIGYVIIALSYTRTHRVKQILYGLIALLVFLVVLVVTPQVPSIPFSVDSLLLLLHVALLAYVSYRMWQAKSAGLVSLGFIILLCSQFAGLVASLQLEEVTVLLAQVLRVVSFSLLFSALALTIRPKIMVEKKSG